jgi:hypothetical protein
MTMKQLSPELASLVADCAKASLKRGKNRKSWGKELFRFLQILKGVVGMRWVFDLELRLAVSLWIEDSHLADLGGFGDVSEVIGRAADLWPNIQTESLSPAKEAALWETLRTCALSPDEKSRELSEKLWPGSKDMPGILAVVMELDRWHNHKPWFLSTRKLAELLPKDLSAWTAGKRLDALRKERLIEVVEPGSRAKKKSPRYRWVGLAGTRSKVSLPVMRDSEPGRETSQGLRGTVRGVIKTGTGRAAPVSRGGGFKTIGGGKPDDLVAYYLEGLPHMRTETVEELNRVCPEWESLSREELNRVLKTQKRAGYNA